MQARTTFPMVGTDTRRIEANCARLALTLGRGGSDRMGLLRKARVLKAANRDLKRAVQERVRFEGRTHRSLIAESALNSMERHLRQVLLEDVSHAQLHHHLTRAVDCSFDVLDALQTEH